MRICIDKVLESTLVIYRAIQVVSKLFPKEISSKCTTVYNILTKE